MEVSDKLIFHLARFVDIKERAWQLFLDETAKLLVSQVQWRTAEVDNVMLQERRSERVAEQVLVFRVTEEIVDGVKLIALESILERIDEQIVEVTEQTVDVPMPQMVEEVVAVVVPQHFKDIVGRRLSQERSHQRSWE